MIGPPGLGQYLLVPGLAVSRPARQSGRCRGTGARKRAPALSSLESLCGPAVLPLLALLGAAPVRQAHYGPNLRRSMSAIDRAGRRIRAAGDGILLPQVGILLPRADDPCLLLSPPLPPLPPPARFRRAAACPAAAAASAMAGLHSRTVLLSFSIRPSPSFSASASSPSRPALASPVRDSVRPPCASARARTPAFRAPSCRPPSRARASPGQFSSFSAALRAPNARAIYSAAQAIGPAMPRQARQPPPFAPRADPEIDKGLDTFSIFPLPPSCRQVGRPWPDPPPPSGRRGAHLRDAAPAGRAAPGGRPGRGCPRPGCARPRPWRAASRLYGPVFSPVA